MIIRDFGMDTASLAGPLDAKLAAIRRAGFSQVMISASEVVGHPGGVAAGIRAVRDSGLAVTGLETLRDFEGLDGRLRDYKVDVAKSMLRALPGARWASAHRRGLDVQSRQYDCRRNSP